MSDRITHSSLGAPHGWAIFLVLWGVATLVKGAADAAGRWWSRNAPGGVEPHVAAVVLLLGGALLLAVAIVATSGPRRPRGFEVPGADDPRFHD